MAFFQMNYHSGALKMGVSVNVILPEWAKNLNDMEGEDGKKYKTLYLLHGLSDDHTTWMRRTSIERYADKYGIAVVMPGVARSWYTDTADGAAYLRFVAKELPDVCCAYFRGMSKKREDKMIAGLSMGGYGALKAAFTYPYCFGGCASLSGTLDIADHTRERPMSEWRGIFGFDLESPLQLKGTEHDLFHLIREKRFLHNPMPKIYMWCGESDHNLRHNERMATHLRSLAIEHRYETSEGNHDWEWWDLHIQDALEYLLKS